MNLSVYSGTLPQTITVNETAGIDVGAGTFLGVRRIFCQKNVFATSFPLQFFCRCWYIFFPLLDKSKICESASPPQIIHHFQQAATCQGRWHQQEELPVNFQMWKTIRQSDSYEYFTTFCCCGMHKAFVFSGLSHVRKFVQLLLFDKRETMTKIKQIIKKADGFETIRLQFSN